MAQETTRPVLYSFRRCPYAMRARLALQVSCQEVELREVVLRDKPAQMIEASAKATVPVLVTSSGDVVDESLDVMLWALRRNDPENWLSPQSGILDEMLALIGDNDGPFKTHLDRYKYATRHVDNGDAEAFSNEHRDAALTHLRVLEKRLASHPYLFGSRFSLADAAIAPFVRQFANTDRAWFDAQPLPHLQGWLKAFLSSTAFAGIMRKYPQWRAPEDAVIFPEVEAA
ncbi:MAG: glutathione S-transferase [Pseudomonadota bacterium]